MAFVRKTFVVTEELAVALKDVHNQSELVRRLLEKELLKIKTQEKPLSHADVKSIVQGMLANYQPAEVCGSIDTSIDLDSALSDLLGGE